MGLHKGLIGKSEGGGSVKNLQNSEQANAQQKQDVTLKDYIQRKTENMGELGISKSMERRLIEQQWFIDRRIACPEAGYPSSEARFDNVFEYVMYLEN